MYGEVIKNLEVSKFQLLVNTPVVQIIDKPVLPLEDNKIKLWLGLLIGAVAGFFAGVVYLAARKRIHQVLNPSL
jgi:uncharacterized protein involved in exopolysaccharide biosynthesis